MIQTISTRLKHASAQHANIAFIYVSRDLYVTYMHRDKLRTAANKLWFPWRSLSQCEERTDPEHRVSPRIHGGTGEEVSLGPHDTIIQHT